MRAGLNRSYYNAKIVNNLKNVSKGFFSKRFERAKTASENVICYLNTEELNI